MNPDIGPSWQDRLEAETRQQEERGDVVRLTVTGLTILGHPDLRRIGERTPLLSLSSGRETSLSRLEPSFVHPGGGARRPLADPYLSRQPLVLAPGSGGGVRLSLAGSTTAVACDGEPLGGGRELTEREVAAGVILMLSQRVVLLLHRFLPLPEPDLPGYGLVGESDAILEVRRQIRQVADLELPVLLRGETGTGKELLARAIHQASRRRDRPYLTINMGAVPVSLAAAELFGVAKGAFTGADRRRQGYFSLAHGGTLFLDEIGEVTPEVQPLLLRALENGEIQPVGAEATIRVDVRTIAATDSDLEAAIASGNFRAPLLHRLGGYQIRLPALRDRRDDIGRLFVHFLREELEGLGELHRLEDRDPDARPWIPAAFLARLAAAPWPGNVRQLRNIARHLAVDSRGFDEVRISPQLERLLDSSEWRLPEPPPRAEERPAPERGRSPMEISEDELLAALRAHRWHPGATACQLGISRPALYNLIDACPRTRKAADLDREEIERAAARCGGRLAEMVEILEVSEDGLKRRMKKLGLRL